MKHKQASIIFGTAISAAAIAVAIDHSKHLLPEPVTSMTNQLASQQAVIIIDEGEEIPVVDMGDCNKPVSTSRKASPCSL